ncbi:hypothetical protein V8G54_004583 [Vigna mungo]|uniref:Cupin type-1 domain-containing protein n=1 Tax=Vigna mungo TaxID=3915 RepID=A0AAQ3PFX3_VIGMU
MKKEEMSRKEKLFGSSLMQLMIQNDNRLFTKVLNKYNVFVLPIGLIHFQENIGYGNVVAIIALSRQNLSVIIANVVFGYVVLGRVSIRLLSRILIDGYLRIKDEESLTYTASVLVEVTFNRGRRKMVERRNGKKNKGVRMIEGVNNEIDNDE